MDEILDILDENYQVIGQETRKKVHEQELLHAAFQCWFYTHLNKTPYIMFQRRNPDVNYPNLLDITAAGHLTSGEGPIEGAREIEEELGVNPAFDDLVSLGIYQDTLIRKDKKKDREVCHLYAFLYQDELERLNLNQEEVAGIVCMTLDDFQRILQAPGEKFDVDTASYQGHEVENMTISLSIDDFVPHSRGYYKYVIEKIRELL
ncbi:NUDIX hydrolase [Salinibacillus xinjiangensis]|uniref:NUDIX domain-containing protein n=1 Tax=Salinibacillus xinjiangensis TaxID=1229268 RepID=A0A6G1X1U5_9BACI|nr:NUDIX domain-containing protein [Salinibacillus xinjiangensis]MRG84953.1 NUDIX domain-containing protein [Salinibacillus xinjiangensis]